MFWNIHGLSMNFLTTELVYTNESNLEVSINI